MSQIQTSLDAGLYAYLLASEPPEHEQLCQLRHVTQGMPNARMQILPEQGHFLAFLVKLIGARHVLELGTFTGYSAMALALALPADGKVVTFDLNEESVSVGLPFWERAGVTEKIEVVIGPAFATLCELTIDAADYFDLIFIDADKMAYDYYYECALRLVRPGGLVVLDNMLQRGEVANIHTNDPRTLSIRALNTKVANDERVDRVILPVSDGMTLARRRR